MVRENNEINRNGRRDGGQSLVVNRGLLSVLKCLLFSYILTGGLLLLLALLLYRLSLSEQVVSGCIIGIYIIATFFAGFMTGKCLENRKFLWGLLEGILYFAILVAVSLLVNHSIEGMATGMATAFCICGGSGMLGGMLS